MDYLLKSSVIVILFYACYQLFLQRETFFVANRWFLLLGLLIAAVLPLIIIPIYVEYMPVTTPNSGFTTSAISDVTRTIPTQTKNTFDIIELIPIVYIIGLIFFTGKLISEFMSLFHLIKHHRVTKNGIYNYIETESNLAPFSFFNWIVYNPNQFDAKELQLILNHEKVHVRQFHSIDVIMSKLVCALFWFNPIIWLYKKALQQNLEFIADSEAQLLSPCEKSYQNLLLKTSISSHQLTLTNNFYNSLIKKRIVMLHKSKSKRMNAYKYAFILPLLALFIFNFNTEVIAQTKTPQPEDVKIGQNVLKYVITKGTKDKQLESIKEKLAENDVTIIYKDLKRNDTKDIVGIRIEYNSKKGSGEFFINSDEPIKDIAITLNLNENRLSVGQAMKNLSQSFEVITEDGDKKVKTSGTESNVFVYSTDEEGNDTDDKIIVVGKDGENHEVKKEKNVYVFKSASVKNSNEAEDVVFVKKSKKDTVWIKQDVKNIVWTDDDGKEVEIIAVEQGNKNFKFQNDGKQPFVLLDGKEINIEEIEQIKPEDIENVTVFKGDKAMELYGKKGKDGVISIISKKTYMSKSKKSIENPTDKANTWGISTKIESTEDDDDFSPINSYSTSYVTKNTIDKMLEVSKKHLKSEGVIFNYSKLTRDKEGIIVKIKVDLSTEDGQARSITCSNKDGIPQISMGIRNGELFLKSSDK